MNKHAAVTIVSKNYLAYAATLAKSYKTSHPDHDFIVILVDRADGFVIGPLSESGAEIIEFANIPIPDIARFIYRYGIMELNTAVKPFALAELLRRRAYETILYLDPDILVFRPLVHVYQALKDASIVLTPHIRSPYFDTAKPNELAIIQSGTYNLGFIGLRNSETTQRFLDWWCSKLHADCVVDIPRGLFVDQKWIDLVPAYFPDHRILHHPGYNVAYWNLHERPLSIRDDGWFTDQQPLVFFHFSGYSPSDPNKLSKHQDRHQLARLPVVKQLTDQYRDLLLESGYAQSSKWPYAFETLPNGVRIPLPFVAAAMQWALRANVRSPCPITQSNAFCRFLMSRGLIPGKPKLVLLYHFLLMSRPDVANAFPVALHDSDEPRFRDWITGSGVRECALEQLLPFESNAAPVDLYATQHANTNPERARSLLRAASVIGRILNVYFLRPDLQSHFGDLSNVAQIEGFCAWLDETRYELELSPSDIGLFDDYCREHVQLIAEMLRLYRDKERANPGITTDRTGTPAPVAARSSTQTSPRTVNLAGYFTTPSGMGESARSMRRTLAQCAVPVSEMSLPHPRAEYGSLPLTPYFFGWPSDGAAVSVTVANADCAGVVKQFLPDRFWAERNVGYWVWETEKLPDTLKDAQEPFDEIWTPSHYSAAAIAATVQCAVRVVPHSLDFGAIRRASRNRRRFGLPEGSVLFGFLFDPDSGLERKNVSGLIDAFRAAFRADDNCHLVLKVNGRTHGVFEYEMLRARCESEHVLFLESTLDRAETYNLMASFDVYASLHRSEGFGLTCAEAMALGLPVVATGYSGNRDFMNDDNSLLIDARVVETQRPYGPYPAGTRWGQPDMAQAAESLRRMLDSDFRMSIGRQARISIESTLSDVATASFAAAALRSMATSGVAEALAASSGEQLATVVGGN